MFLQSLFLAALISMGKKLYRSWKRCVLIFHIFFTAAACAESCSNPKVDAISYTPSDAQVLSHIAFLTEFTLTCSNNGMMNNLYADVDGSLLPVMKSADGSKYLVSWTKEIKHAKTGDYSVNLYDDEGYASVKRILERGENPLNAKPVATIVVNYPGAYKGPWINSELLALTLAMLVFYLAFSSKAALLA